MRGAKEKNPDERMIGYRKLLAEKGYTRSTVWIYMSGVRRYLETGNELTEEAVDDYYSKVELPNKNYIRGIKHFIQYINGQDFERRDCTDGSKTHRKEFHGCNEDCFNCEYPDCYKPFANL